MSWANSYIEALILGETVQFRPKGNSMTPLIKSGDLVTVAPICCPIKKGDIVLCKVNGRQYLHLVKAVRNDRVCLIGNNHGRINGWSSDIYGKVIRHESTI